MKRWRIASLFIGMLVFMPVHGSEIFKCEDAMGRITFQDGPCHSAEVEKKIASAPVNTPDATNEVVAAASTVKTADDVATKTASNKTASGNKSFAWRISKGKQRGYLMGSIHFGNKSMYPLPVTVVNAFKGSDALVVEANIAEADPNLLTQTMMSKGLYSDGTTLKAVLDAGTWKSLNDTSANLGFPAAMIEGMRPWFASMTLTAVALKKIGLDETLGIDQHFLDFAKKERKPIRELESLAQQLALLSGFSQKVQVAMLKQTIDDLGKADAYFDKMLKAWKSGDPQALNKIFIDDMKKSAEGLELHRAMVTDRNVTMTKGIDAMLKAGCNCFVVVGAGHIGGEQGIAELLKARGYQLEQL